MSLAVLLSDLLMLADVALAVSALLEVVAKGLLTGTAVSLKGTLLSRSIVALVARRIVRRLVGFLIGGVAKGIAELLVGLAALLLGGTGGLRLDWLLLVVAVVVLEYAENIFGHYNSENHGNLCLKS